MSAWQADALTSTMMALEGVDIIKAQQECYAFLSERFHAVPDDLADLVLLLQPGERVPAGVYGVPATTASADGSSGVGEDLWDEVLDPNTNRVYYYNRATGESSWTKPEPPPPPPPPSRPSARSDGGYHPGLESNRFTGRATLAPVYSEKQTNDSARRSEYAVPLPSSAPPPPPPPPPNKPKRASLRPAGSSTWKDVHLSKSSAATIVGVTLVAVDGPGGGVRITDMMDGGLAKQCGELHAGDVVLTINGAAPPAAAASVRTRPWRLGPRPPCLFPTQPSASPSYLTPRDRIQTPFALRHRHERE